MVKEFLLTCIMVCLAYPSIIATEASRLGLTVGDFKEMETIKEEIEMQNRDALIYYNDLVKGAERLLPIAPFSVTKKTGIPPSGSKHDYMTLAPYFWPDPDTPDGLPYIRKDGKVNPSTRNDYTDFNEKSRFFDAVDVLGKAFFYSGDMRYSDKAISLIRAWFIDSATRMNPHLNYGQGIPGEVEGRPFGIIEFGGLIKVLTTLEILERCKTLDSDTKEGVKKWLWDYAEWMQTSEIGIMESTRRNNHGTTYDVQLYNLFVYLNEIEKIRTKLETVTKKRIDTQIEPDGSQPHELTRTKAFSYSVMNLSAFTKLAILGQEVGVDLWNYRSSTGSSLKKAYEFLIPYITTDKEWPYEQITSLNDQKTRFVKLLKLAGEQFGEDQYLEIVHENLNRLSNNYEKPDAFED